jgi:type III secretory pathway component EscU
MKELASQINSILQYIMLYSILRNIYRFDSLTDLQASTIKILIITNVLWFFIAYIFLDRRGQSSIFIFLSQ